eukprot:m.184649 g.184649  ORF g.184649 m.184649 type:complete len:106 (-) comp10511_c0_seq2:2167-2484(-)
MDRNIRLWNPFVNSQCAAELVGHISPIVALALDDPANRLISLSTDAEIRVRIALPLVPPVAGLFFWWLYQQLAFALPYRFGTSSATSAFKRFHIASTKFVARSTR